MLVDVFARIKAKHNDILLLLVGDGEVLNTVRQKSKEYDLDDSIILTGAVARNEVHEYLSLLDIAVFTHSNDFGSPVVMFEFMGLKIPIIAPKLLPITDVLNDGQDALLFDVLDMKMLEDKLDHLIETPELQNQLADTAFKLLMSKHTWRNNAEGIVEGIC